VSSRSQAPEREGKPACRQILPCRQTRGTWVCPVAASGRQALCGCEVEPIRLCSPLFIANGDGEAEGCVPCVRSCSAGRARHSSPGSSTVKGPWLAEVGSWVSLRSCQDGSCPTGSPSPGRGEYGGAAESFDCRFHLSSIKMVDESGTMLISGRSGWLRRPEINRLWKNDNPDSWASPREIWAVFASCRQTVLRAMRFPLQAGDATITRRLLAVLAHRGLNEVAPALRPVPELRMSAPGGSRYCEGALDNAGGNGLQPVMAFMSEGDRPWLPHQHLVDAA